MADNFEKFMRNNRQEFDLFEPAPDLWDKIDKNVQKQKRHKVNHLKTFYRVAAVLIIVVSATYVFFRTTNQSQGQLADKQEQNEELNIPELQEIEGFYTREINQKMNELKPILASYPGLDEEIDHDMSNLDSIYKDLKNDLKDNVANREVIEAMIQNYRTRLNILEELLTMLEPEENTEPSSTDI